MLRIAGFGETIDQKKFQMCEGYFAETCAGKIPLVPMGVRAEGPACADPGARPPSALAEFFKVLIELIDTI